MFDFKKKPEEKEIDYLFRVYDARENGLLDDYSWVELAEKLNEELGYAYGESAWRKDANSLKKWRGYLSEREVGSDTTQLEETMRELKRERMKLSTEKIEYNRMLREQARDELLLEKVIAAIREEKPLPSVKPVDHWPGHREGVLALADTHFGKQFTIYGLGGKVLNQYSTEIFYQRMRIILSETVEMVKKEGLSHLHIYVLGDFVDGLLRHSQLKTLEMGVIDSAVEFGKYMADWLTELSEYCMISYQQTDGNHDELRLLDGKKGQHLNESAGRIVIELIQALTRENSNIHILQDKTGLVYDRVCDYTILGVHGEFRNGSQALKDYTSVYGEVDYLMSGHKHHINMENTGVRKGSLSCGSVMGADEYSVSLLRMSDATASFFVFEEGKGKVDEHTIVLN